VHRFRKGISAGVALGIVASVFTASPALAAQEVRMDIQYSFNGYYTITNVVGTGFTTPVVYKAVAPVTVTFHGDDLAQESIQRAELVTQEGAVYFESTGESVRFTVKNFTYYEEAEIHDELTEELWDIPYYVTGNYAVLTEPGYYLVTAGPEAVAPTTVAIEVLAPDAAELDADGSVSAIPTPSTVLVNGKAVAFEAYNINGYNYFKLRDLAMALNGSEKQFEVTWDGAKNAITLLYRQPYTPVGGELTAAPNPAAQQAVPSTSTLLSNGVVPLVLKAYNIGGYNYFRLRDIAALLDFGVTWDATTGTIGIDTSIPYSE